MADDASPLSSPEDELQIEGFQHWVLAGALMAAAPVATQAATNVKMSSSMSAIPNLNQTSTVVKQALYWLDFANVQIPSGYKIKESDARPRGVSAGNEGYSYRDSGIKEIIIPTWSDIYKRLQNGTDKDAGIKLASVIVHELSHMEDGRNVSLYDTEERAYNAQIDALQKMGAKSSTINTVKAAKKLTLDNLRKRM
jgi:hypothetical protein